ncbi:hypothetical protein [Desulfovibrio intestinalis]|uniref:Uncharacterized protein n=1 Tax=Desulfovibrio intestinalis TaxID=58621 RepID=A0A7W8FFH7_9BACT|nr:hypothetical protein [Desulfovibrio intestinalis]MBB5142805.1 hypothetical protein [Desulfovibrio intestinalis]
MSWCALAFILFILLPLPLQAEELLFTPKLGLQLLPELSCTSKDPAYCVRPLPQNLQVTAPVVEDPDWYVAPPGSATPKPQYVGCQSEAQYLLVLTEALQGNPVAMADLVIRAQCASATPATAYPGIPAFMRSAAFWLEWATKYTSPGWVYSRLALYGEGMGNTRSAYTRGAFLGDPKSMHAYATRWNTGTNLQWLLLSADAGYAPAAHEISRWYRFGGDKCGYTLPDSPNESKARQYLSIAMSEGYAHAFGDAVYEILVSGNAQAHLEDAYAYTQIGRALDEADNGLLLADRPLPQIKPVNLNDVLRYAKCAFMPLHQMNTEEKHFVQAAKLAKDLHPLEPQGLAAASNKATAWLLNFQKHQEAHLTAERERRDALTTQLREQCLSALAYIATVSKMRAQPLTPHDDALAASGIPSCSRAPLLP